MFYNEVCEIVNLVGGNDVIRTFAIIIASFSIILGIFFHFFSAILIFSSYILGFMVCWCLTRYQSKASFYLQRFASFYKEHLSTKKDFSITCPICKSGSCKRHKSHLSSSWKNLRIHNDLNNAVEHFYNKILENFISSWYRNFTNDVTFVNELRVSLRYASARLINRILEVDASRVITRKLVPCAIKHIDDYLCMQQIAKLKNMSVNKVAAEYLGKRLHVAATNRTNELKYLRNLTSCLLPHILSKESLNCKNFFVLIREIISAWVLLPLMDVLADPNMINSLVILIVTYKPKSGVISTKQSEDVEFLHNFINKDLKKSSFACDLKSILKTTDLLYAFMQYLKKEGPVNILQFCLDIEDFNNKLLTPDMSKKQLENLHTEAMNLYKIYFNHKSTDYIGCSSYIESRLGQLLQEGVYNVAKLRTSEPLYQAYDYAFNILETECLPGFFHSNEFYNHICGLKITAVYAKLSSTGAKNRRSYDPSNQGTVAKISSGLGKIKGVLKPNQPVEGSIFPSELQMYANGPTAFVEDILIPDCENIFRDLSAWKISIPSVETQQFSGSKPCYIFNIKVQKIDGTLENEIKHWAVARKDQDFYTLKNKLIEFHGENEICDSPLPSRRTTTPMETRRIKYENFLRSLLQKHSLRGSDLLHTFLTTNQDFTLIVTATVPVVEDLGNIYQSVAFKLRKEKGQHLDTFMNTFLLSTGKSKQSKFEWAEIGDELEIITSDISIPPTPATYRSKIFNDNFCVAYGEVEASSSTSFNPNGIAESLFYLLKHIFKIRQSILKLYAAICTVAQQTVESISQFYIDRKLRSALSQSNLAHLVKLLEEVVFESHSSTSEDDLLKRKEKAFLKLQHATPYFFQILLGDSFVPGLLTILEILQNSLYNKQLTYSLLDIVVAEMYPELNIDEANKI